METVWTVLDLVMKNLKSADARDGIFVVVCSRLQKTTILFVMDYSLAGSGSQPLRPLENFVKKIRKKYIK